MTLGVGDAKSTNTCFEKFGAPLLAILKVEALYFRVSFLCPDCMTRDGNRISPDVTTFKCLNKLTMAATY